MGGLSQSAVNEKAGARTPLSLLFASAVIAVCLLFLTGSVANLPKAVLAAIVLVARPHVAFLGRIPGTQHFSDLARHPDNKPVPGALLFRVESSQLYFNTEHIATTVLGRVRAEGDGLRLVVCDLSTSPYVDLAGARMLEGLHDELVKRAIALRVVEARAGVRDLLRAEGLEEKVGRIDRFKSVTDVIDGSAHDDGPEDRAHEREA